MPNQDKTSNTKKTFRIVAITIIAILVLLIAFYLIGGTSTGFTLQQFIGIIVAAALSGVITLLLLSAQNDTLQEQRKGEAKRDKDVKIYSNKIAAFSSFNKAVWQKDLENSDPNQIVETIKTIRKEFYSKVILYLNSTEIDEIVNIVNNRGSQSFQGILSPIVDVLNKNAGRSLADGSDNNDDDPNYSKSCQALWIAFNEWIHSYDELLTEQDGTEKPGETDNQAEIQKEDIPVADQPAKTFNRQPWHFCMWSVDQLNHLDNHENELSLVEYQELWRTKQVKQVKLGDIVFLFRGNWRYSGVFKALGWRVLSYSTNEAGVRVVSEEVYEGISPIFQGKVLPISEVEDVLEKHDIYGSYNDGSTSCANIVVETLSYIRDGVVTPNGTYRKTISRYDRVYAVRLLEAFFKADPSCRKTIEKSIPGFLNENNL